MDLVDLLFPRKCVECGQPGKYLCTSCLAKVQPGGWRNQGVYSLWRHEGVIRKAILALKYKFASQIAGELADLAAVDLKLRRPFSGQKTLVPIPLHWYRENWRGFNQAVQVGEYLAEKMGWQFKPGLVVRVKSTQPQALLKGSVRRQNLRGVFTVNPDFALSAIRNPIIVFDDVYTTGSTLYEAIKTLQAAGLRRVWGLTLAG